MDAQVNNSEQIEMEERLISGRDGDRRNDRHIGGARTDIWLAAAGASLPMLLLSAILLGLTFANNLDQGDPWFRSANDPNAASDRSAYYLDISATRYVTVASWTSSIAPHLSSFILILFSYHVVLRFWSSLQARTTSQYPTPFQLSLLLRASQGGLTPLVALGKYRLWKHKRSLPGAVTSTYSLLLMTLLLGYGVWAADTWLHVTTSAVSLARGMSNMTDYQSYGRNLDCSSYDRTTNSCSTSSRGLNGLSEAFWTLNNISSRNAVATFQLDDKTYAYLTDSNLARGVDYKATSYAMTTQCTASPPPCLIDCYWTETTVVVDYSCGQFDTSLTGNSSTQGGVNTALLYLSNNDPTVAQVIDYSQGNPFSFAALAMMQSFDELLINYDEPRLCGLGSQYLAWMLLCSSTVYDITYRWTNGSFEEVVSKSLSSQRLASTLSSTFVTNIGSTTLFNAVSTAAGEREVVTLANTFSLLYSKTAMALSAGVFDKVVNLGEGEGILGTRVEKAPLFTLVFLNLLYIVLGVGFALAALLSQPDRTQDIQARLSVEGLIARCFEGRRAEWPVSKMKELFSEWNGEGVERIGIVRSDDGGWKYKSFKQE